MNINNNYWILFTFKIREHISRIMYVLITFLYIIIHWFYKNYFGCIYYKESSAHQPETLCFLQHGVSAADINYIYIHSRYILCKIFHITHLINPFLYAYITSWKWSYFFFFCDEFIWFSPVDTVLHIILIVHTII